MQHLFNQTGAHYNENQAGYITNQIVEAINYMHVKKNIAHRDLKPDNVMMVNDDPDSLEVKVTDFGFSCASDCDNCKKTVLGTLPYMAPELVDGSDEKDTKKYDIWSIGVIAY